MSDRLNHAHKNGHERIKAEAWQEQRILVVALDDERLDWVEREVLRKIGEKFYGG